MQAKVVIVGAAHGIDSLIYDIAPELEGRVAPGHRVLVPLRSRKLTAVVLEVGDALSAGPLRPIAELMDPQPIFDDAHLHLLEFLASYYMAPLGDAYRSVIPAVARIESRLEYRLACAPNALRAATLSKVERRVVDTIGRRPARLTSLERLGPPSEVRAALARLAGEGIIERHDATRGRHREVESLCARVVAGAPAPALRGPKQREVFAAVEAAGAAGLALEELAARIHGARPILKSLARRGILELAPLAEESSALARGAALALSDEQKIAVDAIAPAVEHRRFETFLIWGVTGSGKTEVYLHLAARALDAGRQVLVMVPEIALADEVVRAFRARFGAMAAIAHSAQNVSERWASWMSAIGGAARIMIGPRSAIFAPMRDLGLVIVDEEHDAAYKSEDGIRYHARDLAVALGGYSQCPVVLGSATPSAESFANSRRGRYRLLRLARRVNNRAMAQVEIVDLRRAMPQPAAAASAGSPMKSNGAGVAAQIAAAASSPTQANPVALAPVLIDAIRANLAAGGQTLVFLNRRGFHNFLQCNLCGNVIACANCSVSMTFHLRDRSLRCHYCGAHSPAPEVCPECRKFGLSGQGFGTEQLTSALEALFPDAVIERMDSDTSGRRGARARILAGLRAGEIEILVGTQMITKGFDFPGVTLAAVVLADVGLNMPDFRSAERTFQVLTQVAGRAGRGERAGRVIIQTRAPHHYSIRAAADQDYARFVRRELELRRELDYPPFARLAMVRIEGEDARRVARVAAVAAAALTRAAPSPEILRVLGPAPAPIERIKQRYRWQVMLKSKELRPMRAALAAMRAEIGQMAEDNRVYLIIDIDPVRML
ncbi:MAG TPA: primosomal protein N' [Candidatus Binataceae bacterium]|nr:primosomal protein N' [Candidatus Binataceae bacterium]